MILLVIVFVDPHNNDLSLNMLVLKYVLFFYIRTSKFYLRLAVLNFFFIFEAKMFLIYSYFLDRTLSITTEYNKNTLFHYFHSFSFKQGTNTATGRCSTKNRFFNCAKTNQKIHAKEFNFSLKLQALLKFTKLYKS